MSPDFTKALEKLKQAERDLAAAKRKYREIDRKTDRLPGEIAEREQRLAAEGVAAALGNGTLDPQAKRQLKNDIEDRQEELAAARAALPIAEDEIREAFDIVEQRKQQRAAESAIVIHTSRLAMVKEL